MPPEAEPAPVVRAVGACAVQRPARASDDLGEWPADANAGRTGRLTPADAWRTDGGRWTQ
jgi:hypothetical protein